MYNFAAIKPPKIAHKQQQTFRMGITESMPKTTPPIMAGFSLLFIGLLRFHEPKAERLKFRSLVVQGMPEAP
jgi:hypothetical protein